MAHALCDVMMGAVHSRSFYFYFGWQGAGVTGHIILKSYPRWSFSPFIAVMSTLAVLSRLVVLFAFCAMESVAFQAPIFQFGSASYLSSFAETKEDRASTVGETPGDDPYTISDSTIAICDRLFPEHARDDGYVHSLDAGYLFSMSGADIDTLRQVWSMADGSDGPLDNKLNEWEFSVAMHLIVCITRKGMAVPRTLPPSLRNLPKPERVPATPEPMNGRQGPQDQYREYQEKIQQEYQQQLQNQQRATQQSQQPPLQQAQQIQQQQQPPLQSPQQQDQQIQQQQKASPAQQIPMNTPARQSLPDNMHLEAIPGKGIGVITDAPIVKGAVVGDYKGEVMTLEEKDRRYLQSLAHLRTPEDYEWQQSRMDRGQTVTGTYLYGIAIPHPRHGIAKPKGHIYVDAEDEYTGSLWTRFINHASPPDDNLKPQSLHVGWDGNPRVWFTAKRDIEAGEELTFDYGEDYWLEGDNVV